MDVLQIVGYVGSALVALSLTMNNLLRLRWINLFGAATFATYGFFIKAYPVLVLNGFITLTDLFYLFRMYRQLEYFDLLRVHDTFSPYLERFVSFFKEDIAKYFPDFKLPIEGASLIVLVMRNLKPAGLFIGRIEGERCVVLLDYVTPEYRDMKGGHFLWGKKTSFFLKRGINVIESESFCQTHEKYLKTVGFQKKENGGSTKYYRQLEI